MPTRSRTGHGRRSNRCCRAGCNAVETLNHILQQCQRTHRARIERHNAITAYIKRALGKRHDIVDEEPRFNIDSGLLKPDLVAKKGPTALVVDAQVISEHLDLTTAHNNKIKKYGHLADSIKDRYAVDRVLLTSATLSYRGVWSDVSASDLTSLGIIKKNELKIIATRALIGGLNGLWRFNRTTETRTSTRQRTGVG